MRKIKTFIDFLNTMFPPNPKVSPIGMLTCWAMEEAWNAAVEAAKDIPTESADRSELNSLKSHEFRDGARTSWPEK